MGNFEREGAFKDRAKFIEGFKASVGKVMGSGSPGVSETGTQEEDSDVGRVAGFGAKVELKSFSNPHLWAWIEDFAKIHVPIQILQAIVSEAREAGS